MIFIRKNVSSYGSNLKEEKGKQFGIRINKNLIHSCIYPDPIGTEIVKIDDCRAQLQDHKNKNQSIRAPPIYFDLSEEVDDEDEEEEEKEEEIVKEKDVVSLISAVSFFTLAAFCYMILKNPLNVTFLSSLSSSSGWPPVYYGHNDLEDKGEGEDGNENKNKTTFDDVAGLESEKQELMEIVQFLNEPEVYEAAGAKMPRGYLLSGGPGLGKTLLAKAVAGEAGVPFIPVSGSEFIQLFVGVGASRVRDLWKKARSIAPCIIFIDELDAIGKVRGRSSSSGGGGGGGGVSDEQDQTLNQLLIEMDGFFSKGSKEIQGKEIVVIAATNRFDVLDPALTRPGRFDRHLILKPPNRHARLQILKQHAANKPMKSGLVEEIADYTPGFSGADLANLLNEAAITCVRKRSGGNGIIDEKVMDEAYDRVVLGLTSTSSNEVNQKEEEKERGKVIPDKNKNKIRERENRFIVAYHEAGHAIVANTLAYLSGDDAFEVRKVTIRGSGKVAGYTLLKGTDSPIQTRDHLQNQLIIALGGRVAEEMIFGSNFVTNGSSEDIKKVEYLSRDMIVRYGFHEKGDRGVDKDIDLSPVSSYEVSSFQGLNELDRQVQKMATAAHRRAKGILQSRIDLLHAVAKELVAKDVIYGDDFARLCDSVKK